VRICDRARHHLFQLNPFAHQRPNKLRVDRTGDLIDQLSIYDGKTLAIHDRTRGYYAVTNAPGDIDGLLHFARDTLDLVPPTGDFLYKNAFELLTGSRWSMASDATTSRSGTRSWIGRSGSQRGTSRFRASTS
jgi:hypothetical protein